MSTAKTADLLLEMVAAIVGSAKEQGLVVFYGLLDGTDQKNSPLEGRAWRGLEKVSGMCERFWREDGLRQLGQLRGIPGR